MPYHIGMSNTLPPIPKPTYNPNAPSTTVIGRDEVSLILDQTLKPVHRSDPTVIKWLINYLECRHAGQAAKSLGLTTKDGNALRSRPDIHNAIKAITERACIRHGYDASEVIERVKEIMNTDMADFQNPDGTWKENMAELAPEVRRAVKKFKVKNEYGIDPNGLKTVTGRIIEVEYWDKMKATELLGREKDIFKETKVVKHDMAASMADTLLQSKRLAIQATEVAFEDVREVNESRGKR